MINVRIVQKGDTGVLKWGTERIDRVRSFSGKAVIDIGHETINEFKNILKTTYPKGKGTLGKSIEVNSDIPISVTRNIIRVGIGRIADLPAQWAILNWGGAPSEHWVPRGGFVPGEPKPVHGVGGGTWVIGGGQYSFIAGRKEIAGSNYIERTHNAMKAKIIKRLKMRG